MHFVPLVLLAACGGPPCDGLFRDRCIDGDIDVPPDHPMAIEPYTETSSYVDLGLVAGTDTAYGCDAYTVLTWRIVVEAANGQDCVVWLPPETAAHRRTGARAPRSGGPMDVARKHQPLAIRL